MYVSVANALTTFLIRCQAVKEEDQEIYAFGLERIVSRLGTVFFLLVAGLVLRAVPEAVVFFFGFLTIRKFGGGYHATTYVRCNTTYLLTFGAAVLLDRLVLARFNSMIPVIALLLFTFVTVCIFAPIENLNNPIPIGRWYYFRLYSLLLAGGACLITALLMALGLPIHRMLALTISFAALYMYVEVIKRRKGGRIR